MIRMKQALRNRKGTLKVANLLRSEAKREIDTTETEEKHQISEEASNSLKSFRFDIIKIKYSS